MKLRITPAIQSEVEGPIEDALAHQARNIVDPSDAVYLKIKAAANAVKGIRTVTIEADAADVRELVSRAENEVGVGGVCNENIADIHDFADRAYWLGRKRAYCALLRQLKAA